MARSPACFKRPGCSRRRSSSPAKPHIGSIAQYEALWNAAKDDPKGVLGRAGEAADLGARRGTRCWTGSRRSRSGSSAESSTRRITASTATAWARTSNKAAIIWEGEPGDRRVLRYQDLLREVSKFANVLKGLGVKKGDVVAVYMPLVPELVIALLACARIGAPAHGDLRRIQRRVAIGTDPGLQGQGACHGRRRISPRQAGSAQGERRRRGRAVSHPQGCGRLPANGHAGQLDARPRPLVARARGQRVDRLPRRTARQRASALHPLHLGIDRQTQGNPAHDRRLSAGHDAHRASGFSTSRTTTPSGARPTSAG